MKLKRPKHPNLNMDMKPTSYGGAFADDRRINVQAAQRIEAGQYVTMNNEGEVVPEETLVSTLGVNPLGVALESANAGEATIVQFTYTPMPTEVYPDD